MDAEKRHYEPPEVEVLPYEQNGLQVCSQKPHRPGHGWGDGNHEHDKREEYT